MADKKPTKDKFIKIRVSIKERDSWNEKANKAGLTLANYIRKLADEEPTSIAPATPRKNHKFTKADPELILQLTRLGNNLNQIARRVNQSNLHISLDLLELLLSIERRLKQVQDAHQIS